jgi:hypothetical protein
MMRWRNGDSEAPKLRTELDAAREQIESLRSRVGDLEERNTTLVQLAVASQLLAGVTDREAVLDAIEEIVINMIGSEEMAIFEISRLDGVATVARVRGVDPADERCVAAQTRLREAVSTGQTVLPLDRDLTAVVPLAIDGTAYGAVAVFRLLSQKGALDSTDHEMFELLSRQAAVALLFTSFRSLTPTVRPPPKSLR